MIKNERVLAGKEELIKRAKELKDKGYSNIAIAAELGIPESSVRRLVKE